MRRRPFQSTALIAMIVALADVVIKLCALTVLGQRTVELTPWLGFAVHFNEQMGWGLTVGTHPALLTLGATAVILTLGGLVIGELERVDRWAPIALGLLAGAGIANALDGLVTPRGAVDFIVVAHSGMQTVLNGADLAVLFGVTLCCRTVVLLGLAIDRERQPRPRAVLVPEMPVRIPLYAESARGTSRAERDKRPATGQIIIRPDDRAPRA